MEPHLVVTGNRGENKDGKTRCKDLLTPPVRLTYFCSESGCPSVSIADGLTRCIEHNSLLGHSRLHSL